MARVSSRRAWARWLYSGLLYLLSPLLWWRVWREWAPTHPRCERLGLLPRTRERPVIWLHAASLGEVRAARPLIEALRRRHGDHEVVVTTMTATGAEAVRTLFGGEVRHHFVALDFPGAARRFVGRLRPRLALFFETELWPNLLHACRRERIPVAVINARLSDRAMQGYRRIRPLMADALGKVDWLAARSREDAERFRALGMAAERLVVAGSLKFDVPFDEASPESKRLRSQWGKRPVWIAASTHEGEDEQVLAAHARLRKRHPEALLVLVPRHPRRFDDVAVLCQRRGEKLARRSREESVGTSTTVYLGDTMGELTMLYGAADMAFVGGSLVPIGGHNLLEPAALGVPVVSGPALANFLDVAAPLRDADALIEVTCAEALGDALSMLVDDAEERRRRGAAGRAVIENHRGALETTLAGLAPYLS